MAQGLTSVENAVDDDTVGYWRVSRSQVGGCATSEDDDMGQASEMTDESDNEYDILYPSNASVQRILNESEFVDKFMPSNDSFSESVLRFCGSFPVRMGPILVSALIKRFTDARFNWETKTLQSFLELAVWSSVTVAAYTMYNDLLFAFQVGTFVGALMSICDEMVLQFVRGLARIIRNQQGGSELLQKLGFDIPTNGKAPTDGQEVVLIKNLIFGYLGVVAIRSLWEHFHDVKYFALLTAAVGVAFIVTAEFCCLWLPTRRIGLTLQSRFTKIGQNWRESFYRSLFEVVCWMGSTMCFYYTSQNFLSSFQLGTLVAVGLSLCSGLDELPDADEDDDQVGALSFWREQSKGNLLMTMANWMVKVESFGWSCAKAIQDEAMNMFENWGE